MSEIIITYSEQLKCAKRELDLRRSVYPKLIMSGKMSEEKAEHEIRAMAAIVETLTQIDRVNETNDSLFAGDML